jgi:hypothetical protein
MSGCGTSLEGRAIVEVYKHGMNVYDYDRWVQNYIAVQQGVAEGKYTPEEADWSLAAFYIKDAKDKTLTRVNLHVEIEADGKKHVCWTAWSYYDDGEYTYKGEDGRPLTFDFDPYEGLERFTLTIVPRESTDEPMPESWNGKLLFACPEVPYVYITQIPVPMWDWINDHSLNVGVSADVLVTPYGEPTGVDNAIATREIAVRRAA